MKRIELFFLGLLVPLDYAAVIVAALSAYALRYGPLADVLPTTITIPFREYLVSGALFGFVFVTIFALAGLYNPAVRRRIAGELPRIILSASTGMAVVIVTIFLQREFFASRFIVLAAWSFVILYVFGARSAVRIVRYSLLRAGVGVHRIVLIGNTPTANAINEAYRREHRWASRVVARFGRWDEATRAQLAGMHEKGLVDDIMLTDPSLPRESIIGIQTFCDDRHLGLRYTADLLGTERASIETVTLAGVPVIVVKRTPLEAWGAIAKRVFDLVLGTALLIALSPVLLALAIIIKLDSPGPVLFSHTRVGRFGEPFRFHKFRSMRKDAHLEWRELAEKSEREGPLPKLKADPRITPVGRFIRRWSLDELPQLLNVIDGTMSLVGPRPHLPEEVAKYAPHQRRVLAVHPGITGLAQISGRADLPFDDEVRLDNYYIEHWSPYLDLIILVKTPFAVISKRGAY